MKKFQRIYGTGALLVVASVLLFWWYTCRIDHYNFINDRPLIAITVDDIGDYFSPNTETDSLQPEQLVEIEGRIKEINTRNSRHTILLKGKKDAPPYIICDMLTGQEKEIKLLKENDTIKVKGVFKGFLKDAVFLNCMITYYNSHE